MMNPPKIAAAKGTTTATIILDRFLSPELSLFPETEYNNHRYIAMNNDKHYVHKIKMCVFHAEKQLKFLKKRISPVGGT